MFIFSVIFRGGSRNEYASKNATQQAVKLKTEKILHVPE